MPYISVDIDLSDFDTEDLIEELDSRNKESLSFGNSKLSLLEAIWLKRRNGQPYDDILDKLIYTELGKVL
jgi:hypothetical protein